MAGIAGGFVFVASWFSASVVLRSKGPHTWGDAQGALRRLQDFAGEFRSEHGHFPDARDLNNEIEQAWRTKDAWSDSISPDLDDDLALVLGLVATDYHLRVWEQPPRFIVDSALPGGCGFFLAGEDQQSSTSGRDPDDLNSWEPSSADFYNKRLHRQRFLRDGLLALPPALVAGWIAWRRTNRPSRRIRGRYVA